MIKTKRKYMKSEQIVETPTQKRERLAISLKALAPNWPYSEKIQWSFNNGLNHQSVERYLRGEVSSIPLAEKLEEAIKQFIRDAA